MSNNTANAKPASFPEEIRVSVVFTIKVNSQDERDAYIDPLSNLTTPAFLLDLLDLELPYSSEEITAMNGLTYDKLNELNRLYCGL